jgi:hypothetical protein
MKKLNEVLNGVMNDILTEAEGPTFMDRFYAAKAAAEAPDVYGPADVPGGTGGVYHYRYGQKGNPNGVQAADPTQDAWDNPEGLGMIDRMSAMWNGLSDGQKMALLGGVGGTALAAGAGALYLRRKQRDANRALGR